MSRKEYYRSENNSVKNITEEIHEEIKAVNEEETKHEVEDAVNVQKEEIEEEIKAGTSKEETVTGEVINCTRLNIRKKPDSHSEVATVVNSGTELMIYPDSSTAEWYKVYTESGVEGFCMKNFVTVK